MRLIPNHSTEGNPICYPMYVDESRYAVNATERAVRLQQDWDLFQQPLDADVILACFGDEGMKHYCVLDNVQNSKKEQLLEINGRAFGSNLCVGDFISILWADGIKLRLTNWALINFHHV